MAEWHGGCLLNFLRNCQLISKAVMPPDMTNSSVCEFQSLRILISTSCGLFYLSHSHRCLSRWVLVALHKWLIISGIFSYVSLLSIHRYWQGPFRASFSYGVVCFHIIEFWESLICSEYKTIRCRLIHSLYFNVLDIFLINISSKSVAGLFLLLTMPFKEKKVFDFDKVQFILT